MNILDAVKSFDEEQMIEFLYRFSLDVIDHFSDFVMPDRERIRRFLEKEKPEIDSN